ncbi:TPA: diversity-generating retroelement protein bAvd family protein [Candidatus Campbellbacteria bacterium]|nr:MAG: hypothetical protein UR58_C0001G0137 [Candidatus Campbellbacteria bacterium GW2011_OD1_34_28]KKP75381.1 MAG: 23S ribosomal protein [Candidatus Campbellbacteria bacterium GW2011_GWD2_35_24]KKP76058.1 MAG: 30S ribosomal protein S23 [Candidatus Campbellbacteria bacterium GW2011_GWC2_35_28]KKP77247.1 MAG: 23S ribosomal protein [Candidatus Campbellbacteria bacterium GW2011_GWC1_35_31]KKP79176.1 MAG: 23S ribosomal protein [Candidatus Campbellbacteria bacterium GW2011_GWD1_35_49]HAP73789.1 di
MTNKIKDFTDLIVWKKAHEITLNIYKLTKKFPDDEKFCLTNQMRRCSVSIVSNIAEGFGRSTAKDKAHFYAISKGSVLELKTQLILSRDLDYINKEDFYRLEKDIMDVTRLLSGIVRSSRNIT